MTCYHCNKPIEHGPRCPRCPGDIFSGIHYDDGGWDLYFSLGTSLGTRTVVLEGNRHIVFVARPNTAHYLPTLINDAICAAAEVEAWETVRDIATRALLEQH